MGGDKFVGWENISTMRSKMNKFLNFIERNELDLIIDFANTIYFHQIYEEFQMVMRYEFPGNVRLHEFMPPAITKPNGHLNIIDNRKLLILGDFFRDIFPHRPRAQTPYDEFITTMYCTAEEKIEFDLENKQRLQCITPQFRRKILEEVIPRM